MKNKELIIGIGVVVVVYLLWKRNTKQVVSKNDSAQTPSNILTEQEKIALFEKAINSWKGGVAPPREWEENNRKEIDLAKAKIKELKLETEFSTWLSNRPKVDYGNFQIPQSLPKVADRPCKKWIQPNCITHPCPQMCAEY